MKKIENTMKLILKYTEKLFFEKNYKFPLRTLKKMVFTLQSITRIYAKL